MRHRTFGAFVAPAVAILCVLSLTSVAGATPEEQYKVHIVSPGENLTVISRRYGVPLEAVIRANAGEIPNPDLIYPGQRIRIPVVAEKAEPHPALIEVQTIPPLSGVSFSLDGHIFVSDAQGIAWIQGDSSPGLRDRLKVLNVDTAEGIRAKFVRWYGSGDALKGTFELYYLVSLAFDVAGNRVDPERVTSLTLRSSHGVEHTFDNAQPRWLQGSRPVARTQGIDSKELHYTVESVIVDGQNVVNRSQQKFFPSQNQEWQIQLLFYSARFSVRDALFRFPIGSGIRLEYPDGHSERFSLGSGGELTLESLPRGEYRVSVEGPGISLSRPLALSRNQEVQLELISYLDIAVAFLLIASVALGLLFIRRPHLLSMVRARTSLLSWRRRSVPPEDLP